VFLPAFLSGKFDFYVGGELVWAIKLLMEMEDQTEHLKRFEGVCAPLNIPAANIRVAELRSAVSALRMPSFQLDQNRFLAVTSASHFRSAIVQGANFLREVQIRGAPPKDWQ